MSDQKKLMKPQRTCVGCGSTAPVGLGRPLKGCKPQPWLTESRQFMLGVSCLLYRRGKVRATRNVNICEACFVQAFVMGTRSKVPAKLFAALRERLSNVYNSMRAEDK